MQFVNLALKEPAPWNQPRQKQSNERVKLAPGWHQMLNACVIQTVANPISGASRKFSVVGALLGDERGASKSSGSMLRRGRREPHAGLLTQPAEEQLLYKIMTIENLLRSIDGAYLHFNRVDSYGDDPGADPHDGAQLPTDLSGNAGVGFEKAPAFTAAHYYDRRRSRTYACCFGLENADYLWHNYGNGSAHGKIGLEFAFGSLRARLNAFMASEGVLIEQGGVIYHQIFHINYGIVRYVDWESYQANIDRLPNPIEYIYLKATRFKAEKELRVTLSTIGLGHFVLNDGSEMIFPPSTHLHFDIRAALIDGTIRRLLCASDTDTAYLRAELDKRLIGPARGTEFPD
jgi:hypothetical protein